MRNLKSIPLYPLKRSLARISKLVTLTKDRNLSTSLYQMLVNPLTSVL
jgi:hypothetical protein